jgi:hypothetical protein
MNSANHFGRLDQEISKLFVCRLSRNEHGGTHIGRTSHLLARLPQAPPDLYLKVMSQVGGRSQPRAISS